MRGEKANIAQNAWASVHLEDLVGLHSVYPIIPKGKVNINKGAKCNDKQTPIILYICVILYNENRYENNDSIDYDDKLYKRTNKRECHEFTKKFSLKTKKIKHQLQQTPH